MRWTDGRVVYALLMGVEGAAPERGGAGVALVAQLADYEAAVQTPVGRDARSVRAGNCLMATLGGIQAVSFQRVPFLHPRDADHLLREGRIRKDARAAFLPNNVGVHGPIGLPRPLREYVDILEDRGPFRLSADERPAGRRNHGHPRGTRRLKPKGHRFLVDAAEHARRSTYTMATVSSALQ